MAADKTLHQALDGLSAGWERMGWQEQRSERFKLPKDKKKCQKRRSIQIGRGHNQQPPVSNGRLFELLSHRTDALDERHFAYLLIISVSCSWETQRSRTERPLETICLRRCFFFRRQTLSHAHKCVMASDILLEFIFEWRSLQIFNGHKIDLWRKIKDSLADATCTLSLLIFAFAYERWNNNNI